jgi:hypothetical protein
MSVMGGCVASAFLAASLSPSTADSLADAPTAFSSSTGVSPSDIEGFDPRLNCTTDVSVEEDVLYSVKNRSAAMKNAPKATTIPKF